MRTRSLVVVALLILPAVLTAQVRRLPGRGGAASPQPAPLPPEIAPVTRALAYKRSRWATEGYSMMNSVLLPGPLGNLTRYTSLGAGTRADYRYTDQLSVTLDMTASVLGGPANTETAEVGTRYSPLSWDHAFRPYVDVRAAYVHMSDVFSTSTDVTMGRIGDVRRMSRGPASLAGAGFDYSLTRSMSLTGGVSAMRGRMSAYRLSGAASDIANGTTYWMTCYRVLLGLRFNPVRTLHLAQNPRS